MPVVALVGREEHSDSTGGVFLTLTTPWACLYKPLSGTTTDGQSESSCLAISPRNVAPRQVLSRRR